MLFCFLFFVFVITGCKRSDCCQGTMDHTSYLCTKEALQFFRLDIFHINQYKMLRWYFCICHLLETYHTIFLYFLFYSFLKALQRILRVFFIFNLNHKLILVKIIFFNCLFCVKLIKKTVLKITCL